MDTKQLARQALALVAAGEVPNLIAAVGQVVKAELASFGGSTARQERAWFDDVLRVARAAEEDARALNGGAGRGQGRPGNIAEAASRLRQLVSRQRNREADVLSDEALRSALADVRSALADLEGEAARRRRTYRYEAIPASAVSATDLRAEIRDALARDLVVEAYRVTIYDAAGERPAPEAAQAVYLPSEGRLGIAWGADATWADVADLESGLELWLNDGEAWERAN